MLYKLFFNCIFTGKVHTESELPWKWFIVQFSKANPVWFLKLKPFKINTGKKNMNERFLVLLQLVYAAFPYYHIHTYASIFFFFNYTYYFIHTLITKLTKFLRLITWHQVSKLVKSENSEQMQSWNVHPKLLKNYFF